MQFIISLKELILKSYGFRPAQLYKATGPEITHKTLRISLIMNEYARTIVINPFTSMSENQYDGGLDVTHESYGQGA
ncbi:hypothetical protein TWF106_011608 [Orbilia oligospora]|uniref:Uncharacterized protein n=1 Tax=Orbilia oligospora TaxID=2813651 RepID=A0A7C8UFV6_ORBOL|nr:hypothetical protein TWF106_011608 [Orbilia oligospora]